MKLKKIAVTLTIGVLLSSVVILVGANAQQSAKARNTYLSPAARKRIEQQKAFRQQGESYLKAGNPAQAEVWFRKSVDLGREHGNYDVDGHSGLADALSLMGRHQEAMTIYRNMMNARIQRDPQLLLRYGQVCERAGRTNDAAAVYRRAFAVQKQGSFPLQLGGQETDAEVLVLATVARGVYQKGSGDLKGAVATYRQILDKHPNLIIARKHLADALEESGKIEEAKRERQRVDQMVRKGALR